MSPWAVNNVPYLTLLARERKEKREIFNEFLKDEWGGSIKTGPQGFESQF
jgi:hypothetical protein